MRETIKKLPILGPILTKIYRKALGRDDLIASTEDYWRERYKSGQLSGAGSYNRLAQFKADILNDYVSKNEINVVIEFGCGDGNQLELANYSNYLGFDISSDALELCRQQFSGDPTKQFKLISDFGDDQADLVLSLDVIYHLLEDEIYNSYMNNLFRAAKEHLIIYSSNYEAPANYHERHHKFTDWIEANQKDWVLDKHIPNKYPYDGVRDDTSHADFYIYRRKSS